MGDTSCGLRGKRTTLGMSLKLNRRLGQWHDNHPYANISQRYRQHIVSFARCVRSHYFSWRANNWLFSLRGTSGLFGPYQDVILVTLLFVVDSFGLHRCLGCLIWSLEVVWLISVSNVSQSGIFWSKSLRSRSVGNTLWHARHSVVHFWVRLIHSFGATVSQI